MIEITEEYQQVLDLINNKTTPIFVTGGAGSGKEQPYSAVIKTPSGDTTMGELNVGSIIFGRNGTPIKVIAIHEQGIKPVYRIGFRDGTYTECGLNHIWSVTPSSGRKSRNLTTEQLLNNGITTSSGGYKYKIPLCEPVQYAGKLLPFDAYLIGALLGDGSLNGNTPTLSCTTKDNDIYIECCKNLPDYMTTSSSLYDSCNQHRFKSTMVNNNPLQRYIKSVGLNVTSHYKFIPTEYLQSSIKDRIRLLQGLMDTDGSASLTNSISYSTMSKRLAYDIRELVQSLGGTAIIHTKTRSGQSSIEYSVNIKVLFNPFLLARKASRWKLSTKNPPSRYITSIELVGEEKQKCITVDAPDSLYLTDNFIVTHNSTLISYIQDNYRNVVTVAPTGIAALNVNGSTIHSTFRMPPKFILPFDKKQLRGNSVLANADIIIIDEISMVNANMLDTMEYIMRISKQSKVAFGGTPVVMFGDLYQLPPVVTDETRKMFSENYETPYFFSANCLKRASMRTVKLTKVFRQKDDTFVNALNNIRMGTDVEAALDYINGNVRFIDKAEKGCIVVTTTNRKCNEINNLHLRRIKLEEHTFMGKIEGKFNPSSIPVDSIVDLKVGTQVMVAKNIEGAVNGTLGTVTEIHNNNVHVKTNDNELLNISKAVWESVKYTTKGKQVEKVIVGSYTQIPLKLAWAITVHKGQGQTMSNIHIDMDTGAFASGQIYVALSRCRTLEGITLSRPIYTSDIIVDEDVREFYNDVSLAC